MATITLTIQSLLNTAVYDSYVVSDTNTVGTVKGNIESNTNVNVNWYTLYTTTTTLSNTSATLADYGITSNTTLLSANKISRLNTLEDRQRAKLDLAALGRAADSNPRPYYEITELPTQYSGNTVVDNPNPDGLVVGRPWISTPPTPPTPSIITEGLVLYLDAGDTDSYPGTGTTWYDLSPSGKNATLGNAVYYSSTDGGSLTFTNGVNSIATVASASSITSLRNNISIEVWYKDSNLTPRLLSTGVGSNGLCFGSYTTDPDAWKVTKYGVIDLYVGSVPQDTNTWHQAVVTYSSTAGTKVYVDGALSGSNASTGNIAVSTSQTISIGVLESLYLRGSVSIVRWYNAVLSDEQVLQNYTADVGRFTNPVVSGLLIYYDPSNQNSYPGTGTQLRTLTQLTYTAALTNTTYTNPYLTYNGTNSWASLGDGGTYEPGTGDFTVEAWVNATTLAGSSRVILGKFNNGGVSANVSYGLRTLDTGATRFEVGNGTSVVSSPAYTISTDTWYQVVGVWTNVASNSIELYINGVSQGSNSHAFASVLNSSNSLYLGAYNGGEYAQYWDGKIGVYRQYNKALSAAEVLQNFENDRGLYGI